MLKPRAEMALCIGGTFAAFWTLLILGFSDPWSIGGFRWAARELPLIWWALLYSGSAYTSLLLAFYQQPSEQRKFLRDSNTISMFAPVACMGILVITSPDQTSSFQNTVSSGAFFALSVFLSMACTRAMAGPFWTLRG